MFTKAKRPENLYVRILQQNDPEVDTNCLEGYCERITTERGVARSECPYVDQIYIHHIHAKEAAGPTWARGLLSKDIEDAYLKNELSPQVRKKIFPFSFAEYFLMYLGCTVQCSFH